MEDQAKAAQRLKIAVLYVCFNRRETTLRSIRSLMANARRFDVQPLLFDDASSDGTAEAVLAEFPQTILVAGDGTAFWNGGLHRVWTKALDLPVDAFLWLNDDVELDQDALDRLAAAWNDREKLSPERGFILVGATRGEDGAVTYSGFDRRHKVLSWGIERVPPGSDFIPVDTFNGNIVLIPMQVVERIGINDPAFFQGMGDIDYGLRAGKAGIIAWLLPGTLGVCAPNSAKEIGIFGGPELTFRQRLKRVNSHLGLPVASWLRLTRKHSGIWFPLHFLMPYRGLFVPHIVRRWRAKRSAR